MNRLLVVGAGAWGTALALQAVDAGAEVVLAARSPAKLAQRTHPRLAGVVLPDDRLRIVGLAEAPPCTLAIIAVPTQFLRATLTGWAGATDIVLASKGFETGTGLLPPEIAAQLVPSARIYMLSGPNFAHEIARCLPAAAVVAGPAAHRDRVIASLAGKNLRLYGNDDITGVAIGGAAKNVVAIAAGAVMGAGLGENARAAVITRGLAEMARLAVAMGGRAETIYGLSGLGDLTLTCTSLTSRNYAFGFQLGQGRAVADALPQDGSVVEGVATAPALYARARQLGVEMPIVDNIVDLLAQKRTLGEAVAALMARKRRDE